MRTIFYILLITILLATISCQKELSPVEVPVAKDSAQLKNTTPIAELTKRNLEGIYNVISGTSYFGKQVVLKWNGDYLSVFSWKNSGYFVLQGGFTKDSIFLFAGYWRYAFDSETGLASLSIGSNEGGRELIKGNRSDKITITGFYGNGSANPTNSLTLEYNKPLTKDGSKFWIIGHRGGSRNVDRLPASENSLGMIQYAERLGANAIEIDVRTTLDGIPVLCHDEYLSKRLVNEDFFVGKVSDYTFAQLRTFCTLKDGSRMPALQEALQTVVDKTTLKLVWLDLKNAEIIEKVAAIQKDLLAKAAAKGRTLEILIGIPDDNIYKEFVKLKDFQNCPSLCELDETQVQQSNAIVWAPRWSLGLLDNRVTAIHEEGKRTFVWTLDASELVKSYIKKGKFDGIVTNYSNMVAYEYYTSE
jgi:glycerophosphoryl diester phosphodiesterase